MSPVSRDEIIARLAATGRICPYVLAALPDWTLARMDNPDLLASGAADLLPGESGGAHIYRIAFGDGAAYVGMTTRMILDRIEEHFGARWLGNPQHEISMQERLSFGLGTFSIVQRLAAGIDCRVEVLASGLTRLEASEREWEEIARLPMPLNAVGPVRPWQDVGFQVDPGRGAMARLQRQWDTRS